VVDESDLKRLTRHERAKLAVALNEMDGRRLPAGRRGTWRRRILIGAALACTLALAAWIGVLAVTLPWRYRAGGWSAAWVGFDVALLFMFAATTWAVWRRRQVLILCLVVLAVLLWCDAWFDTTLDWGTPGFMASLMLALVVELPLALVAMVGARRLLRHTIGRMEELAGSPGPVPPLWKVPLFGEESVGYREILPERVRNVGTGRPRAEQTPQDQES
jgi:hypothetical protein